MKKFLTGFLLAYLVFQLSIGYSQTQPQDIPQAGWEPIFFQEINQTTAKVKKEDLRTKPLPAEAEEIRIWIGFGRRHLEGFILKKNKDGIKGFHLAPRGKTLEPLKSKKSDLERLWDDLAVQGFFTLPDASKLEGELQVLDGTSYVVEIQNGQGYRTYHYSNPAYQPWSEAKKFLESIKLIRKEFGIKTEE